MIKLHGRTESKWNGDPFVARVTTNPDLPPPLRDREVLLLRRSEDPVPEGFRSYLHFDGSSPSAAGQEPSPGPLIRAPSSLQYLSTGDILRFSPRKGQISVLYRRSSAFNPILLTERCNSNCIMCSQPPRDIDDSFLVRDYLEAIPLMSDSTSELGLTGGEPTLLGEDLIRLIRCCKHNLPQTALHMLSNGRLLSYLSLCQRIARIDHPDFMIGIPLYSDIAHLHEFVVQASGAFDETIRGIMNAKRCGLRIEIRVVLHRETVGRLPQLARFIARNLPFADHVALMGLELMGYVRMNLDALWIDPTDYQEQLADAVAELVRNRMNVSIYNLPLCLLDRRLWPHARKSISDWKNEYLEECEGCSVRGDCAGFFSSGKLRLSDHIKAIPPADAETRLAECG